MSSCPVAVDLCLLTLSPSIVQAVQRAFKPDYSPTTHDHYRFAADRMCAVHQGSFEVDGLSVNFINNRRWHRKHLDLYRDFPCLLYLVNLADYCHPLVENEGQNMMNHELQMFEHIINSRFFKHVSPIVVFMNVAKFKADLSTKPLSEYFPDFHGDGDPEEAIEYVLQKFTAAHKTEEAEICAHVGELTDQSTFQFIVAAIKDSLLTKAAVNGACDAEENRRSPNPLGLYRHALRRSRFPCY